MNWQLPTINRIQRTTTIIALITAALMGIAVRPASALGCLLGAAVMIANLYGLLLVGRTVLAAARESGGPTAFGIAAAPLKMLVLIGLVYWIIDSGRIDVAGFLVGSLTQFAAIFIETWRASRNGAPL